MTDALVLGGGLAGVAAAQTLGEAGIRTTLVDRTDYHQFQPLLYQVATSQLPAEDVARPLRTIFADVPSVDVVVAGRRVGLARGPHARARRRPVAVGRPPRARRGRAPELLRHPGRPRARVPAVLGRGRGAPAPAPPRPGRRGGRSRATTGSRDVVVVGGGPTGVEVSGALAELVAALQAQGRMPADARVHLVDRGHAVLGQFSTRAQEYAHKHLDKAGVDLRLGAGVKEVHADAVDLDDGTRLPTRTVIWAGGESASAIAQSAGPATGRGGRIDVRPDLGVEGYPGVWAVGDVANIPSGRRGADAAAARVRRAAVRALGGAEHPALDAGRRRSRRSTTRTRASWR